MRRAIILAAFTLTACATTQSATAGPEQNQVEAALPVPAADAVARVQAAMAAEGLQVTSAQGNVVVAEGTESNIIRIRYSANVIPAGDSSRVVLTAHGTRPGVGVLPEVGAAVTSTTGGPGRAVWQRLERIGAALSGTTP